MTTDPDPQEGNSSPRAVYIEIDASHWLVEPKFIIRRRDDEEGGENDER